MIKKILKILGSLFIILVLMILALTKGIHAGEERGLSLVYNWTSNSAGKGVDVKVKTLEMLKTGEIEKARELLEKSIDNDLGFLIAKERDSKSQNRHQLVTAIRMAKAYREKYPGHEVEPTMYPGVLKALNLVE